VLNEISTHVQRFGPGAAACALSRGLGTGGGGRRWPIWKPGQSRGAIAPVRR